LKASLVFLDESGLLMTPLVRRSWAPRGKTPLLHQRTRQRQKVSAIAALTVSPGRRRVGLYFYLAPNMNIDSIWVQVFLQELHRHIQNPIILIWDRLNTHRSVHVQDWVARHHDLYCEFLPPYAPELNPVENLWSYLKQNPLANFAAADIDELFRAAESATQQISERRDLLRSFIKEVPLFLRLK
jgi:transposase